MESPLDYLKNSAENDWLIGDGSNKFSQLATQLYLELSQLLTQGTAPKILLAHSDPIDFLAGFIAACAAGCPVFLCNPNWVKHEWQQVFELVQPDLFLGYGDWETRGILLPTHHLPLATYSPLLYSNTHTGSGQIYTHANLFSSNPALQKTEFKLITTTDNRQPTSPIMIPTGGSSGKIRFVIHTWDTLMASVQGFQRYFQLSQINSFCILPLYHVSGLMQFLRSFTTKGSLINLPFKTIVSGELPDIDPADFFISLVPTQLQRILQSPTLVDWLSQFKTVLLGGAPAWQELLEPARDYGIRLAPTYGMTETASQIVTLKPEDFLKGYNNCGQVLPHAQVKIVDKNNQILAANKTGIVSIKAQSLALGYYPELFTNREQFQLDDIGFFDEQGYLNIIGRNSNKIITGGENVYPNEVEAVIRATQLVDDVCVIGVCDRTWGQAVTAVYVPNPKVTPTQIKQAIADKVSKFKQPKNWICLEKLPRNAQGKINREQLHQIATEFLQQSPS